MWEAMHIWWHHSAPFLWNKAGSRFVQSNGSFLYFLLSTMFIPFINTLRVLFARRMCEISAAHLWSFPSGAPGKALSAFAIKLCVCVVHRWNDSIGASCNALQRNHKINSAVLWRQERAWNAWNIHHLNVQTYQDWSFTLFFFYRLCMEESRSIPH